VKRKQWAEKIEGRFRKKKWGPKKPMYCEEGAKREKSKICIFLKSNENEKRAKETER
jgi:hypothetical protein